MQHKAVYLLFCKFTTCFGCQPHPSSGVHKTLTTASGTGHIFCAATSLQRGLAWPRWWEVDIQTSLSTAILDVLVLSFLFDSGIWVYPFFLKVLSYLIFCHSCHLSYWCSSSISRPSCSTCHQVVLSPNTIHETHFYGLSYFFFLLVEQYSLSIIGLVLSITL